ncbi:prepilin-type N-terminal cleavage/methylation domain-containing protein [Chroococcidiopsis sp. CCMEE 29]|uniref:pilus assembly FimT family protein n=1 Tax=Chroococcidiopsis sp. CCMEE 29 TaxID=155894 RepID=UPI002020DC9F|nr:prepilin-type N-terminal cleavage/methylation domain-containing protein [Chroococcidiopsis sp. CCMEE 29]
MPLLIVRRNSQGFTLIETLVILIIIGILSAIAAPSYLGMLNRNKVNDGLTKVRGALQEAQREAIRRSRRCQVGLSSGNQSMVTSNCFVSVDYTIKASAAAASGATTVSVDSLPVAISNGTKLVFSNGANGVVSTDAAKGSTSLTLSSGLSAAITNGEIVAVRTLTNGVGIQTDISGQQITFGIRGNTTNAGTIALFMTDVSTPLKRCMVTSIGVGIMRTGIYSGSTSSASDITAGTCTTSQ